MRLNLYVETYLLTYWRVAAFIWMLIVAAGLILIVVRIVTHRSNAWLISANLAVRGADDLRVQLRQLRQSGRELQRRHARGIDDGRPPGRPHLCGCARSAGDPRHRPVRRRPSGIGSPAFASAASRSLADAHARSPTSWRAWTFRGWRLSRYLEATNRSSLNTPLSLLLHSAPNRYMRSVSEWCAHGRADSHRRRRSGAAPSPSKHDRALRLRRRHRRRRRRGGRDADRRRRRGRSTRWCSIS